jgi:transposase InsO family protein
MHDNGKQFTSRIFRHFLVHNQIKDKQILNFYPQLQGKVEAYNKVVKNEFLAVEALPNIDDGKQRYDMFVKTCNETSQWSYSNRDVSTKVMEVQVHIQEHAVRCNPCR